MKILFWLCSKNVKYSCGPMCKQEWPNNLLRFGESCIAKCKLQTKHDWLTASAQKLSQKHYALHQCHVMYLLKPMEEMNLVGIFYSSLIVSNVYIKNYMICNLTRINILVNGFCHTNKTRFISSYVWSNHNQFKKLDAYISSVCTSQRTISCLCTLRNCIKGTALVYIKVLLLLPISSKTLPWAP